MAERGRQSSEPEVVSKSFRCPLRLVSFCFASPARAPGRNIAISSGKMNAEKVNVKVRISKIRKIGRRVVEEVRSFLDGLGVGGDRIILRRDC